MGKLLKEPSLECKVRKSGTKITEIEEAGIWEKIWSVLLPSGSPTPCTQYSLRYKTEAQVEHKLCDGVCHKWVMKSNLDPWMAS